MNPQDSARPDDDALALVDVQHRQLIDLAAYAGTARNTRALVHLNFYTSQFLQMTLCERVRWMLLGALPAHLAEYADDPEAMMLSETSENLS